MLSIGPDQRTAVVAGTGAAADDGDGGPASAAGLLDPRRVAIDPAGRLYVSEGSGRRVRTIGPDGVITTVEGDASQAYRRPGDLALDAAGTLYVVDVLAGDVRSVRPPGP